MGANFNSNIGNLANFLGQSQQKPIVLPKFQRGFSWDQSHVAAFLNDILLFLVKYEKEPEKASYFLGPVILQENDTEILLLDGQQRFATATIFFAVIRDKAREIGKKALDNKEQVAANDLARDIQRGMIINDEERNKYALTLGVLDANYFLKRVQLEPTEIPSPKFRSHKLINTSYDYLTKEITMKISTLPVIDQINFLKKLKNCLSKAVKVVAIYVTNEDDAAEIFETLNDRGLRLSVPDLTLNYLMRTAPDGEKDAVRNNWDEMLTNLGKRDISRFLRHMWISQYGDVKAHSLFADIKNKMNEKGLKPLQFVNDCVSECEAYVELLEIKCYQNSKEHVDALLNHLRVYNVLPLLLSGFICLEEKEFVKLAQMAKELYIRHFLAANLNQSDLETCFYDSAKEIRGKKYTGSSSKECLDAALGIMKKSNPDKSTVVQNIAKTEMNKGEATWLLSGLGKEIQSNTKESGFNKISLEHIYPQNAGIEWSDRAVLDEYVWNIGNLTLLGTKLNNDAGSKVFANKSNLYYSKSEIIMTRKIAEDYKAWGVKEIKQRASQLGEHVHAMWPGP